MAVLTNLWYACSKWHAAFIAVTIFLYFLCPNSLSYILKNKCIYTRLIAQRLCMNYSCYQITLDRDSSVGVGIGEKDQQDAHFS
jgi:hypothetical protein